MRLPRLPQGITDSNEAANVYQNDLNRYLADRERASPAVTFGTWIPTLVSSDGTSPTVTYNTNNRGRWQKIGDLVFITGRMDVASVSGGTAHAAIGGLPFLCGVDVGGKGGLHIEYVSGFSSSTAPYSAIPQVGTNLAALFRRVSADARDAVTTQVTVAECSATLMFVMGQYFA